MNARSLRFGLAAALGVTLSAGSASAQQAQPAAAATAAPAAAAQPAAGAGDSRGNLHVLGFRAPDGDDEAAGGLTTALRELATSNRYTVATNSPNLEQEVTVLGCSTTGPECLRQISNDIHADRFIYGQVTRVGRGRTAVLNIEVSLWDQTSNREVAREARSLAAAAANNARIRELATEIMTRIVAADDTARAEAARLAAERAAAANASISVEAPVIRLPPPPPQRTPVLRYIGFGAIGVGAAVGIVGLVQLIRTSSAQSASRDATITSAEPYGGWARFQGEVNPTGAMTPSEVCSAAENFNSSNPNRVADAAQVRDLCSSQSTARAMALGMGIGGLVLAGVGAVLVVIDRPRRQESQAVPNAPAATSRLQVAPLIGARTGGVQLGFSF